MIKVGVVWTRRHGPRTMPAYIRSLKCDLVGVADVDPVRAKEIGENIIPLYYSDYRELLSKVEAVSIAVPPLCIDMLAMDFLKAGVHCMVEKPIAISLIEAEEMIEAAAKNHVNLAIGHIERFNPAVIRLKQIIDEGTLGSFS